MNNFLIIRLGVVTSQKPVPVIIISLVFTLLGCLGLMILRVENNAIKLWIPQQSDFTKNYHWLYENYPPEIRQHSVIIHGDDVLTPQAIQKVKSCGIGLWDSDSCNNMLLTFIRGADIILLSHYLNYRYQSIPLFFCETQTGYAYLMGNQEFILSSKIIIKHICGRFL